MLVLPGADNETASGVINRLRQKIEDFEIEVLKGIKVTLTASFGIASYPDDAESLYDLLVAADERLYEAKSLGKNKVTCN